MLLAISPVLKVSRTDAVGPKATAEEFFGSLHELYGTVKEPREHWELSRYSSSHFFLELLRYKRKQTFSNNLKMIL
jgi:hypothetical protein